MGPKPYVRNSGLTVIFPRMEDSNSELDRAIRTALRSLEAAQGDVSPDLAIQHLAGAVHQLIFVVNRLKEGSRSQP